MSTAKLKRVPIALVIMCAMTMHAQVPDAPSAARSKPVRVWSAPLHDPYFYAGTLFHASSVIADVHHVQACERALTCVEANPGADVYKRRLIEIVGVAGMNYGCSLMLSEHRKWRAVCMVLPVVIGVAHWRDATRIYTSQIKP